MKLQAQFQFLSLWRLKIDAKYKTELEKPKNLRILLMTKGSGFRLFPQMFRVISQCADPTRICQSPEYLNASITNQNRLLKLCESDLNDVI